MTKNYIPEELIKKYNNNTCTEEERAIVESWYLKELKESTFVPTEGKISLVKKRMRKIIAEYSKINISINKLWFCAIIAFIIFFLIIGGAFLRNQQKMVQKIAVNKPIVILSGKYNFNV